MVKRWYPTKVDRWLAILLAIAPLGSIAALLASLVTGEGLAISVASVGLLVVVYGGLVFPMRYGIDDESLIVRHGIVRQRIPLREITDVRPTRNPLSSPALSLDRIAIKFGEGLFKTAMISPANRDEFLGELATRANLRRDGERLVRS